MMGLEDVFSFKMVHFQELSLLPIRSTYGIFTYIYHKKSTIHLGKYAIYGKLVGKTYII